MMLPKTLGAFFWYFLRKQFWGFLIISVAILGWGLQQSIWPFFTKLFIDAVNSHLNNKSEIFSAISYPFFAFVATWILIDLGFRTCDFLFPRVYAKFKAEVRSAMFDYTSRHSHQYFSDHFTGATANYINRMIDAMVEVVTIFQTLIFPIFFGFMINIVILYTAKPIFALIAFLWFSFHIGLTYFTTNRAMIYSAEQAKAEADVSGDIIDTINNIASVRLFANFNYEKEYLSEIQAIEVQKEIKLGRYTAVVKLVLGCASTLFGFSMVGLGIYSWSMSWITVGELALIFASLNLTGLVWHMSDQLLKIYERMGVCKQAIMLISHTHDIQDVPLASPLQITKGQIIFENVTFHYGKARRLFQNKSVMIKGGEKVGLVGFSGAGKSTFVNLILRYHDVESGQILIDGQDITRVTQDSLRAQISLIPQDVMLFHRTLMENIRYGNLKATDEMVIIAAKKAHCHEFIEALELGYHTLVGERGIKLSGGQRQRIAIARAILKNAPILILDEATSSLDSVTENYIKEALHYVMQNSTTIVIAHRLSTLVGMDRLLVFEEGKIIEQGRHEELLAKNGHYALLWKSQVEGFLPKKRSSNL